MVIIATCILQCCLDCHSSPVRQQLFSSLYRGECWGTERSNAHIPSHPGIKIQTFWLQSQNTSTELHCLSLLTDSEKLGREGRSGSFWKLINKEGQVWRSLGRQTGPQLWARICERLYYLPVAARAWERGGESGEESCHGLYVQLTWSPQEPGLLGNVNPAEQWPPCLLDSFLNPQACFPVSPFSALLVSWGLHNKWPHIVWPKTTETYFLMVMEVRVWNYGVGTVGSLWRPQGKSVPCLS
jgi:hypothetical protein